MPRAWHQNYARVPVAARTSATNEVFDSAAELRRWNELLLEQRAGEITELRRQVKFPLTLPGGIEVRIRSAGFPKGRLAVYHADFAFRDRGGIHHVVEYKAFDTPDARLRRAVVEAIYGIQIEVQGPAAAPKRRPRKIPLTDRRRGAQI